MPNVGRGPATDVIRLSQLRCLVKMTGKAREITGPYTPLHIKGTGDSKRYI
jgi:hypothetical protein